MSLTVRSDGTQSVAKHHEVVIDLDRLVENTLCLLRLMKPARVCAVLKNNAYGHGLIRCASAIASTGIQDFGVVDNHEISLLRNTDDPRLQRARLWRIRPPLPWEHEECVNNGWDVIEQVGSLDDLDWALKNPQNMQVALALDCSMGREAWGAKSYRRYVAGG